ncbi:glycoside hydrolase family 172 protein [uncultured Draconibacterium sp.]|uniref:glycoside hydrolase family 172 protein n=1 Tax=uncultured Draconibacterium sp. TaxID=1573823 RepID=UPI0029C72411|nr:glycoside hydrolase family 172 protein [uncultured Draconibacterium sp.]
MKKLVNQTVVPIQKIFTLGFLLIFLTAVTEAQELYKMPEGTHSRWSSFENPGAEKGKGAQENRGAKGHAFNKIEAGKTVTLLQVDGAGVVNRIWLTLSDRSPEMLQAIWIKMYWDGADKPAVAAPLGDFFGVAFGKKMPFENALFSDPEGRSFNCIIPMPFKTGAKITLTNHSDKNVDALFYDINLLSKETAQEDILYFHTFFNYAKKTVLTEDHEILPKISGKGRYLGVNMGVKTDPIYEDTWWGEGEVKIYLDGDGEFPTLVGTGAEDYIGGAYGQGEYYNRYQGSLEASKQTKRFIIYRYHIPDPIYFYEDIKVTIQQIGGWQKEKVLELQDNGASLIPVTIDTGGGNLLKLLEMNPVPELDDPKLPDGWTNFYRQDEVVTTAYFYLDRPSSELPISDADMSNGYEKQ